MLAINNMPDHLHFFVGLSPKQSISDMMGVVKRESSQWINHEKLTNHQFNWQDGYGAFSHSKSQLDTVVKYIHSQQEHHRKKTFLEEYTKMLNDFGVDYDERYIFNLPID